MSPARRTPAVATLALAALAAAGCGGSGDDQGGRQPAGRSSLRLSADPSGKLAFDKQALQAKAGRVAIVMKNPADLSHNVSLEGPGVDEEGETVGKGATSTVSATLKPGTYTFYCSVPGHREAGMEGKLTVR
jgi:uncharacterized cupredoxin-like copper-binding protein